MSAVGNSITLASFGGEFVEVNDITLVFDWFGEQVIVGGLA
jgi:hypothetical protein